MPRVLVQYNHLVRRPGAGRIVILARPGMGRRLIPYLDAYPPGDLYVFSESFPSEWELSTRRITHFETVAVDDIHNALARVGPIDTILNFQRANNLVHRWAFNRLFFHLRPGGCYAVRRPAILRRQDEGLTTLLRRVERLRDSSREDRSALDSITKELLRATGAVIFDPDWLLVEKKQEHHLRLTHENVAETLTAREPYQGLREVAHLSAGSFGARCTVTEHGAQQHPRPFPLEIDYPRLQVREYTGRIAVVSNTLIHTEYSMLPESFRHPWAATARNVRAFKTGSDFVRIPERLRPTELLPGSYYHLDSENSGHYGHLMAEDVARLWGWTHAKADNPELKVIFRIRRPGERDPHLEHRLFGAFGIAKRDITWVGHPVYVESLYASTTMMHNKDPMYVHPEIETAWDTIASALRSDVLNSARGPTSERIFVSRRASYRSGNRECRNVESVETFFESHGFEVVYPELLDLGLQARLFGAARVIAGSAGSGMFNLMFAKRPEAVIVLGQDAYTSRNEHLFSAVRGGDVHYFWSGSDIKHPGTTWSREAYFSSWEFDWSQHRGSLGSVLADL